LRQPEPAGGRVGGDADRNAGWKQHGENNLNYSGATAPDLENAAKFRGDNKKVVFTSCSSCFPSQHPSVVLDYCIQHLGAMVNELDGAMRSRVRDIFFKGGSRRSAAVEAAIRRINERAD